MRAPEAHDDLVALAGELADRPGALEVLAGLEASLAELEGEARALELVAAAAGVMAVSRFGGEVAERAAGWRDALEPDVPAGE